MAIYLVTGKLGSGKSLACVGRIRDALKQGRNVATNLDLYLDKMKIGGQPAGGVNGHCVRIPDKPTLADLEAIGRGQDGVDEERNGLIVLDELGAWLNTRSFQDKERTPVIEWLLHSRKLGWDVYFIIQHANMVDKQVREGLAEFLVTCKRTDRLRIPFVGGMLKAITRVEVRPPKVHVGTVRYGLDPGALIADRWWYRGRDLYDAYDTRQRFTSARTGLYTYLMPGYLQRFAEAHAMAEGLVDAQRRRVPKPKLRLVRLLMRLPVDARVKHWRRFEALGGLVARATTA